MKLRTSLSGLCNPPNWLLQACRSPHLEVSLCPLQLEFVKLFAILKNKHLNTLLIHKSTPSKIKKCVQPKLYAIKRTARRRQTKTNNLKGNANSSNAFLTNQNSITTFRQNIKFSFGNFSLTQDPQKIKKKKHLDWDALKSYLISRWYALWFSRRSFETIH